MANPATNTMKNKYWKSVPMSEPELAIFAGMLTTLRVFDALPVANLLPLGAKLKLVMANLCKLGKTLITFKSEARINVTEKSFPAAAMMPVAAEMSIATTPFILVEITLSFVIFCLARSYSKMAAPFPDLNAAATTTLDSPTNLTFEKKYFANLFAVAFGALVVLDKIDPSEEEMASITEAVM